jgi:hypothetical protein
MVIRDELDHRGQCILLWLIGYAVMAVMPALYWWHTTLGPLICCQSQYML